MYEDKFGNLRISGSLWRDKWVMGGNINIITIKHHEHLWEELMTQKLKHLKKEKLCRGLNFIDNDYYHYSLLDSTTIRVTLHVKKVWAPNIWGPKCLGLMKKRQTHPLRRWIMKSKSYHQGKWCWALRQGEQQGELWNSCRHHCRRRPPPPPPHHHHHDHYHDIKWKPAWTRGWSRRQENPRQPEMESKLTIIIIISIIMWTMFLIMRMRLERMMMMMNIHIIRWKRDSPSAPVTESALGAVLV